MDDGGEADIAGEKERWSCADLAQCRVRGERRQGQPRGSYVDVWAAQSRVCVRKQFAVTISPPPSHVGQATLLLTKPRPPPGPAPPLLSSFVVPLGCRGRRCCSARAAHAVVRERAAAAPRLFQRSPLAPASPASTPCSTHVRPFASPTATPGLQPRVVTLVLDAGHLLDE